LRMSPRDGSSRISWNSPWKQRSNRTWILCNLHVAGTLDSVSSLIHDKATTA
jgi:hypothetical protein